MTERATAACAASLLSHESVSAMEHQWARRVQHALATQRDPHGCAVKRIHTSCLFLCRQLDAEIMRGAIVSRSSRRAACDLVLRMLSHILPPRDVFAMLVQRSEVAAAVLPRSQHLAGASRWRAPVPDGSAVAWCVPF